MIAASFTDPNFALSFWTAITFGLLIIVLGKFAWGPILQTIEQREKTIADAIEGAKKASAEAEKAAGETKAALEKARQDAAELSRRSQAEVAAAKTELMAAAKKESEELLAQARKTIEEERRVAVAELKKQAVELAIAAAGKLVQAQMDAGKQKALVEEYLAQVGKPRA
ncbi:MAG: F0F1 ATP synthase subunit B [Deltaproteobacteria bacterium]|nr:F0F1 ATP synthase subunit B [Deltaproteobacteria bacterium]